MTDDYFAEPGYLTHTGAIVWISNDGTIGAQFGRKVVCVRPNQLQLQLFGTALMVLQKTAQHSPIHLEIADRQEIVIGRARFTGWTVLALRKGAGMITVILNAQETNDLLQAVRLRTQPTKTVSA